MIRSVDYQVRLMEFHNGRIREMVVPNDDGSYTIFIESSLSREEQQQAFLHAMRHICRRDFEKNCSVDIIEIMAHI